MADIIVGAIVLVIFATLAYNLFLRMKSANYHSSPTCMGCSENKDCTSQCDHKSPEQLKNELESVLHPK